MSEIQSKSRCRRRRLRLTVAALLLTLGAVGWTPPLAAQDEGGTGGLRARVEERFRVLVLSEGLLLEPRGDDVEAGAIEIGAARLSVDGREVSLEELEGILGEDGRLISALWELEPAARRDLFAVGEATRAQSPEGPLAPPVSPEADAGEERQERGKRRDRPSRTIDPQVVVGSSLTVEADEVAEDVVVIGGPLAIEGEVLGDAAAIGGSVRIEGRVTGDAVAVGGSIRLGEGAEVLGDAVAVGGKVERHETAQVRGEVVEVPFGPTLRFGAWPRLGRIGVHDSDLDIEVSPFGWVTRSFWKVFKLIVIGLLACLVVLLARTPLERVARKVDREPWKAGLVGLVAQILFLPLLVLVVVVLCISIIGIPLLLLVPFAILALVVVAFLGYTAVALRVGDWTSYRLGWRPDSAYMTVILGVLVVQGLSLVGALLDLGWGPLRFFAFMFGLVGALVLYLVWTVGLGAALLTRFGTAEGWGGGANAAAAPVMPPPEPPAPEGEGEPSERMDSPEGWGAREDETP